MILVTHFACCHQYKGYWRSCPLGWSYFTVMPGLNLRAGGAHAPEFTLPQREIDLLYYFYTMELSGKEIARLMGMTENAIRMALTRARRKVLFAYRKKGGDDYE